MNLIKKKIALRILCLVLATLLSLSMAACNTPTEDFGQTEAQTEAQKPSTTPISFIPTKEYVIVYSALYEEDTQIQKACRYLKTALYETYGILVEIVNDSVEAGTRKEFLIGSTNRTVSKELLTTLARNDYAYLVSSENAIAICGGISEFTYEGVKHFCNDVLTFDGTAAATPNVEIKVKAKDVFYGWYPYDSLILNGVLWEDYTMVVTDDEDMQGALELNTQLSQYTGQLLPIRYLSEMTGEEGAIIRIGATYRNGTGSKNLNGYLINTYKDEQGNVFCISASNRTNYIKAVNDLLNGAVLNRGDLSVTLDVSHGTVYDVITTNRDNVSNKQNEHLHWGLESETSRELSEGVTYVEQLFYDDEGLPYRVYTLIVDTKINRLDVGTSNDGYDCPLPDPSSRQHTKQHMEAAVKNGENVIAATNADFFNNRTNPAGNYEPWGFTIKDGILISEKQALRPNLTGTTDWNRPFFGVDKNGNPLIAMEDDYLTAQSRATLEMAVGGAYILTEDGKANFYQYQNDIIHGDIHPRTVVGYREDGTVILMVIDGRQPKHSNGASLIQCSLLMQRFGASDSLLLDGGGSSCMVLRDPTTNQYTTANKPSDGSLRKMFNSILVVKK